MHCKICFFDNSFRSKSLDDVSSVSEFVRFRFRETCESEFFCFIFFILISLLRLAHSTFLFPLSFFPSSPSHGFPRAGFIMNPPFFCRSRKPEMGTMGSRRKRRFYAVMPKREILLLHKRRYFSKFIP